MFSSFATMEKEFILLAACVGNVLNELKKNYVQCTQLCKLNWKMNMDCLWSKQIMNNSESKTFNTNCYNFYFQINLTVYSYIYTFLL